ncbi:MAG: serine hydrolase domain-containing protein [Micropepsaceae bacterium]
MDRRTLLKVLAASPLAGWGLGRVWAADGADPVASALTGSGAPALAGAVFTPMETLFLGVAGVRQTGSDNKVATEDRWHLGSNTKAMTAAVFQRLVEQGRIKAGATLAELFPGMTIDPALSGLTADDLSGHRAGLLDMAVIGRDWLMTARGDKRPMTEQRAALAAKALGAPPPGQAGTFAYGNINFIVLGAAIEQATGMAWEDVMKAELFAPLGMASAGFGAPADPAPWGHMGGRPMEPGPFADNPAALGPAGTVHVALGDYGKWLQMIMKGGDGWLSAGAVAAMTAPPADGERYRRGWGLVAARPWAQGPVLMHEGSNVMWHATAMIAPVRGIAIATMSNDETSGGAKACQALAQVLKETYAPV